MPLLSVSISISTSLSASVSAQSCSEGGDAGTMEEEWPVPRMFLRELEVELELELRKSR